MTALYVPPTDETDHKKQNQSLQLIGGVTSTNTDNIATNTTAITALQAGPLVSGAVAAQSDQETATNITKAVTPGRQQFHPSAAKAWAYVTNSGTASLVTGYNIASVSRTALGSVDVTFTTAMSSTSYAAVATALTSPTVVMAVILTSASVVTLKSRRADTAADIDTAFCLMAFGDQ